VSIYVFTKELNYLTQLQFNSVPLNTKPVCYTINFIS